MRMSPRSLLRPALLALLVGLVVYGVVSLRSTPSLVLRAVGHGTSRLALQGGVVAEVTTAAEVPAGDREALVESLSRRAAELGLGADVRVVDGRHLEVTAIGLPADRQDALVLALTRPGRVAFHAVASETPYARMLHQRATAGELGNVVGDTDSWRADESVTTMHDFFLYADDEAALWKAVEIAGPPPSDLAVRLEAIESAPRPYVRTWMVSREAALDDRDIAHAAVSYDPNTGRPLVWVDFTEDGARRFAELTTALVGQRLAIILDNRVSSAPVVNGAIRGGRASITVGITDARRAEDEASALASALKARSPLPEGLTARVTSTVEPDETRLVVARLSCALVAALLAFLVALALSKRLALWPATARLPAGDGRAGEVVRRALVTVGVVAALVLLRRVPLPGLNTDEWWNMTVRGNGAPPLSVVELGITPLLSAYFLVELVALVIPGWRRRRHAGFAARQPLRTATAILAVAFAALQGYYVAVHLQSVAGPAELLAATPLATLLVVLSLTAGVALHALGAMWISRAGIGQGMAVLFGVTMAQLVVSFPWTWQSGLIFAAALAALSGALTWIATRARMAAGDGSVRLPLSGIFPVAESTALLLTILMLSRMNVPGMDPLFDLVHSQDASMALAIGVATALTLPLAWAFSRPAPLRALVVPGLLTLGYVVALVVLSWVGEDLGAPLALPAAILTALALDLGGELRARWRTRLVAVAEYHDVDAADAALDAEGGHLRGVHMRALLRFFGPFAPVWRMAPAASAVSGQGVGEGQAGGGGEEGDVAGVAHVGARDEPNL